MPDGLTAAEIITALQSDPAFKALSPAEQGQQLAGLLGNGQAPAQPQAALEPAQEAVEGELVDPDGYAELGDFVDDVLRLSAGGVHYDLPAADINTGLECQLYMGVSAAGLQGRKLSEGLKQRLDDAEEADLFLRLLGGQQYIRVPPMSQACSTCGAAVGAACKPTEEEKAELETQAELEGVAVYPPDQHEERRRAPNPRYNSERDVWRQLEREGKSWPFVQHMGVTAMMWAAMGRDFALEYWKSGGRGPKALPPPAAPQDHRPPDTATTTRKRAIGTSGTTKKATARKATARKRS